MIKIVVSVQLLLKYIYIVCTCTRILVTKHIGTYY